MTPLVDDRNGVLWWNRWKMNCDSWTPGLSSICGFNVSYRSSDNRDVFNDFLWSQIAGLVNIITLITSHLGQGACNNEGIAFGTQPFV